MTPCIASEKQESIRTLLAVVYIPFLSNLIVPKLKHMFESILKLSLRIPRCINWIQVLKLFRFLLELLTSFLPGRLILTLAAETIVERATETR